MPNINESKISFIANLTEKQAMDLEFFRATHDYEEVKNKLDEAFAGYLGSDVCSIHDPIERQNVYYVVSSIKDILFALL